MVSDFGRHYGAGAIGMGLLDAPHSSHHSSAAVIDDILGLLVLAVVSVWLPDTVNYLET